MDRDTFIITVYCLVVEHYAAVTALFKLRRGGFQPALTDEEVITMELCGEFFKLHKDRDLFAYFHQHYTHFFPHLSSRSRFVRQAADLWQVKAAIQKRLVEVSQQAQSSIQPIDTLPLPVCTYTRAPRDRCFKFAADYGYCAAKQLHYYGFKLGLRVTLSGMITHYRCWPPVHTMSTIRKPWSKASGDLCLPIRDSLTRTASNSCDSVMG
jgi:hypothetical protein